MDIWGQSYTNFLGINYIKIDVIQGKIQLFEFVLDVIDAKIGFIGLTPESRKHSNQLVLVQHSNGQND